MRLRARSASSPNDAAVWRELAAGEELLPGGDPRRAHAAIEHAARLAPDDPGLALLAAQEAGDHGRVDEALAAYLRAIRLAAAKSDPGSQAIAEVALDATRDTLEVANDGVRDVRAAFEALDAQPGHLSVAAQHLVREELIDLAYRRGDLTAVHALAQRAGCITSYRVAGPFGPRDLLGFDATVPAQGRGRLADHYDLGPGRGDRPTRDIEARGCTANLGGGAISAGGATIAEGTVHVDHAGQYVIRLETPNSVELFIDGTSVARMDARREPTPRTSFHPLELSAGDHELEVKVVTRHPNPVLVASVLPATENDAAQIAMRVHPLGASVASAPDADGLSPLEAYVATAQHLARGDIVSAREIAHPRAEAAHATSTWLTLRSAISLGDPFLTNDVRRDQARAYLRRAAQSDPTDWYPPLQLARLDAADGRAVEAIAAVRAGVAKWPNVIGFHLTLADLYNGKGWDADSDAEIRRAHELVPTACGPIRATFDAARRRDRDVEAQHIAEQLVTTCDARSNVRYDLLVDQRRWDDAAHELARLATFEPPQNKIGYLSAQLDLARGRGDDTAVPALIDALAHEMPRAAAIPLSRADRTLASGDQAGARQELDHALDADPGAMADLRRVRRAIGGLDELAPYRKDGAAILREFLASGHTYTQGELLVFDYAAVRIYPDGSSMQLIHQIYKVQSEEAVNDQGEFHPPDGARILTLQTIKADGRRLEPDAIAGKDTISLPNLEVGDYVESEYVVLEGTPGSFPGGFLGDRFYFRSFETPFDFSSEVYIVPRSMNVVVDPRGPAPTAEDHVDGDLRVLTFTVHESRPLVPEPGSVNAREYLPSINVGIGTTWAQFVDGMRDVLADKDIRDPAAERTVRELLGDDLHADDEHKARKLYAWVLERIEQTQDFFGQASPMLASHTGHRARVLAYMLRLAGVNVDLVAARSVGGDTTESPLPDADTYSNAILRVHLPHGDVWLSTGDRGAPFGYIPQLLRGQDAIVITEGGPHVRVAPSTPRADLHETVADVTLHDDHSARIDVVETLHGEPAVAWRNQLEGIPAAELDRRFEQDYVTRLVPNAAMASLTITGRDTPEQPLVLKYSFDVSNLGRRSNGSWTVPSLFPSQLAPSYTPRPDRSTTELIPGTVDSEYTIRFHTTPASMPPVASPANVTGPGGATFTLTTTKQADTWTVHRSLHVPLMRVEPTVYPALATFCRQVDETEGREVVFRR